MAHPADDYLDLLARCLTASIYDESAWHVSSGRPNGRLAERFVAWVARRLRRRGLALVHTRPFDHDARENGTDWPMFGYSMIGLRRMRHLRACVEAVIDEGVPGT